MTKFSFHEGVLDNLLSTNFHPLQIGEYDGSSNPDDHLC